MQHLEVSGAVRYIYIYIFIYVIRQLKVNQITLNTDLHNTAVGIFYEALHNYATGKMDYRIIN